MQERLDEWSERLKASCDQFQSDRALVRALEADEDPEFQKWFLVDGEWRLDDLGERVMPEKELRRRVGNAGLHGCSEQEIGMAWALADAVLTLPDIATGRLTYTRPSAVPTVTHFSEPVEPWNGQEFDGVEVGQFIYDPPYVQKETFTYKSKVRFYWSGDRYAVEDLEPFAEVRDADGWRATTMQERDLMMTGIKRKHLTRAEIDDMRDEWVDQNWEEQKAEPSLRERFPDGVPRSFTEEAFERVFAKIDEEAAADEQREVARRRMAFMRQLRRR